MRFKYSVGRDQSPEQTRLARFASFKRCFSLLCQVSRHKTHYADGKSMNTEKQDVLGKVPEVTLLFWIIKILATTLGETGGDAVSMSMNLGYLVGTGIFAVVFLVAVGAQIRANRFHPFLYWTVIVATTTVGTTLADFVDRSLGIGYLGGSSLLAALVIASLVT